MTEMDTKARVQAVAAHIIRAHQTRAPFNLSAGEVPASTDEAYAVQDSVAALWRQAGDAICAWKTGGPNAEATPVAAPIPQSKLFRSPVTLHGKDFNVIGIEAELAYSLADDLPPRATPYTEADVVAA
ncbi:MAG TPA: 2-keto-4-pentenoate hydratase, partial [Casimicrobiaceae bacterium]